MNEHLKTLQVLLAYHDWYYNYSDDYSQYNKGKNEWMAICSEEKRLINEKLATVDELKELKAKYFPKNT